MLTTAHNGVELSSIRSIWYRDPGVFEFPAHLTATERTHAFAEARLGIGGVLSSLDALWMNEPNRACDAEYRPRQLTTAMTCGLPVARTLVTNDKLAVHYFARASERGLVQKALGSNVGTVDDRRMIHYARRTSGHALDELTGVELTAHQLHQFQHRIDLDHEVQVVVVGDRLFPVALDRRSGYESLRYEPATLPADVEQALHCYMTQFGLTYAVIDLAVDRDGRHVFLGSNSAGRFGRLEVATDAPITDAVADALAAGPS